MYTAWKNNDKTKRKIEMKEIICIFERKANVSSRKSEVHMITGIYFLSLSKEYLTSAMIEIKVLYLAFDLLLV